MLICLILLVPFIAGTHSLSYPADMANVTADIEQQLLLEPVQIRTEIATLVGSS